MITAETVAPSALAPSWQGLRRPTIAFAVGLVALGLLFHTEIAAAVSVWMVSTAYNHCFLVLPIALYLGWERRELLCSSNPRPMPRAALLALPLGAAWLVAERLGIMEGRQLVLLTVVQLLVAVTYGWRGWWVMSGPLLYLYFLVPFGEFLVPKLQDVTTTFVQHGLQLLRIPAYIDGYVIEIPEGTFFIAEACAGLRFLIASIAFGCLYALMIYRSPGRRAAFILASIVIPVIANGFRALGIVWLGHVAGSAQAAATDHVLYGWIFFSIVMMLLVAVGLPFREDGKSMGPPPVGWVQPAAPVRPAVPAVALLLVLAAVAPVAAAVIDRQAAAGIAIPGALDLGPGCTTLAATTEVPRAGAAGTMVQRVTCAGVPLELRVVRFSPRSTAGPVLAVSRGLAHVESSDEAMISAVRGGGADPATWRLVQTAEPAFAVASAFWIEGRPATDGLATRIRMAWDSLTGGALAPVVVAVSPAIDWQHADLARQRQAVAELVQFLENNEVLGREIRLIAAGRS